MSETSNNPNSQPNYKLRRAVVAGAVALTGLAAAEAPNVVDSLNHKSAHEKLVDNLERKDALEEYLKGDQIPHDKAVRLAAPDDMSPNEFAKDIKKDNGAQWELTQQIKPQADFHLDPGLQGGEQVIVEKSLVDPDAIKEYGVEDLSDPNRQDPASAPSNELPPVGPIEEGHTGIAQ